ncbi:MAG: four helix bundle protein [Candidatus Magasanikbacteria bacterium]|nr:four helix bundle protein [Candidatus Magasanikbacteria bacterium]
MAQIKTFHDLQVWQKAHQLVLLVYKITVGFPSHERYGLVSQMRRAAVSVAANLVEGFRRKSLKDSVNFYHNAAASLEELKYFLLLSQDIGYLNSQAYTKVAGISEEVSKLLTRWIQSQHQYL